MSYLLRNNAPIWQEMADFGLLHTAGFTAANVARNVGNMAENFPGSTVEDCLICYPSLDRFAPIWRLPVTLFSVWAENGLGCIAGLVFSRNLYDSDPIITPNKGRKSCLRHPTSSQQLRCFPSPLALRTMLNALLLAQALLVLAQKLLLAATVQKLHSLAASSGHLPTTSETTCRKAIEMIETAAAGQTCERRFCF